MWTPNLALSLVCRLTPGCKSEGQVAYDNHCLLLCLTSPSIRSGTLQSVALNKKREEGI